MSNTLTVLYRTNRKLINHVRNSTWFYIFAVSVSCVSLLSVAGVFFFLQTNNTQEYQILFAAIVFFVVMFDIIAVILRIQSRSFIAPYQLALFPISKWKIFFLHFVLLLMDYKTLIYISMSGFFLIFFIKQSLYIAAIASMLFWMLLHIVISSFTILGYGLIGRFLNKMESKLQFIGLIFMAAILGIQLLGDTIFIKIPVISYTGNALYGLLVSDLPLVGTNLMLLLGCLSLALILFRIMSFDR